MAGVNNALRMRRDLMVRLAALYRQGRLLDGIDRVPLEVAPRSGDSLRCCVYKDRAVLKYRLMALLGYGMEDERDELTPLSQYAAEALGRREAPGAEPSVLDIACDSCSGASYLVTDACRGCVARPCTTSCPKGAIQVRDGRARIDPEACVNCGKCQKACPFHAIIYRPVPCEQACPVDAVEKDDTGRIRIDREKCVSCGKCLSACPFAAVMDRSHMIDVLSAIGRGERVVAAVAPAGIGQFSAPFEQLVGACRDLGFAAVHEVAAGAEEVADEESRELLERLEGGAPFMTSSCCPAYTETVERHLPALKPYVSHTESPMIRTGRRIRREDPAARVVFIGPCLAKKREALRSGEIDYVLSFEELGALFVAHEIDVQTAEPRQAERRAGPVGRGFPLSGGVSCAVRAVLQDAAGGVEAREPGTTCIDGLDAEGLRTLRRLARDPDKPGALGEGVRFLEVMACPGGCVGGPLAYGSARSATRQIEKQGAGTGRG